MSLREWAKREVEIACARERAENEDSTGFDYGCACYESALKAFNCLMEDEHSGMSIGITKQILNRLIECKPLTPIEDTEDVWNKITWPHAGITTYQCKRMSSLFKDVHEDGTVSYHDNDRVICKNVDSRGASYHWRLASDVINKMFPITMPYVPDDKPYVVVCKEFLYDKKNGDFDTVAILHVVKPDSEVVEINRYFGEIDGEFVEIDAVEYCVRLKNRVRR